MKTYSSGNPKLNYVPENECDMSPSSIPTFVCSTYLADICIEFSGIN